LAPAERTHPAPRLKVLGHSEIPDTHSIRIGSIIGSAA
jgi:flagellar biosynthesis protein FlhA